MLRTKMLIYKYVVTLIFQEKDTYGNEVSRLARPLPVEYLLVDVPASTPLAPQYTFYANGNITPFPIEHRYVYRYIVFSQLI